MAIRLPQQKTLAPIRPQVSPVSPSAFRRTTGIARGIERAGEFLGQVIRQRNEIKRRAQEEADQTSSVAQALNIDPSEIQGLSPIEAIQIVSAKRRFGTGGPAPAPTRVEGPTLSGQPLTVNNESREAQLSRLGTEGFRLLQQTRAKAPAAERQNFQVKKNPRTGLNEIFDKRTGTFSSPLRKNADSRADQIKARRNRADINLFNPKEISVLDRQSELFDKDKTVIALQKRINESGSLLSELVSQNPKGAIGLINTQFTRFAGEVGRLTDEDIKRNAGSPAIADKLLRVKARFLEGKLSEEDVSDFTNILEIADKTSRLEMDNKLDSFTQRVSKRIPNADKNFLRQIIGGNAAAAFTVNPFTGTNQLSSFRRSSGGSVAPAKSIAPTPSGKVKSGRFTIESVE